MITLMDKYWNDYISEIDQLNTNEMSLKVIQEKIISKPLYGVSNRQSHNK